MLEELLERKGRLSRQIGEAKRSNEPVDNLLAEMKAVSANIAKIKNEQKQTKKKNQKLGDKASKNTLEVSVPAIPDLFSTDQANAASDDEVTVREVQDSELSMWDAYVSGKSQSSVYHFSAFKGVIESSFGHHTYYFAAFNKLGNICGVLPAVELKSRLFGHFIVSLPYFTYGAALADSDAIADVLYQALFDAAKTSGAEHVELRATMLQSSLQQDMPAKLSKVSMVRSLPNSAEQLWDDVGTKVRAQIKKAQRFELTIKFGQLELLDDYYHVFAENMRDLGTPVYSKMFFKELITSSLKDSFEIGVVYFEGKPVSTCFLMSHKGMMEIPWASALNSVNHMNVNMYMYWEILQRAIEKGNKFFDFGRSSKDAGTYRFKKQWGAEPQQLYWYYWLPNGGEMPELNPNNPKYKLLIAIWQRLPVWFTKLIGPPVVKYLP